MRKLILAIPLTPPNVSPSRDNSLPRGMLGNNTPVGGRLAVWLIDSSPMLESLQKDLKQISQNITQLAKILDQMSSLSVTVDSEVFFYVFELLRKILKLLNRMLMFNLKRFQWML